jgi:hypothetical protein
MKLLNIEYVSTKVQVAYGFAKPLPVRQLEMFKQNLNLVRSDSGGVLEFVDSL